MAFTLKTLLLTFLALYCFCGAQATTMVVFYDPINGAILGIDSSVTMIDAVDFQRNGRTISSDPDCKLQRCGRYFVASTGQWGLEGQRNMTDVCRKVASISTDIDGFTRALQRELTIDANVYVSALVDSGKLPRINEIMFSIGVIGFQSGAPAMRFTGVMFGGVSQGQAIFDTAKDRISCPGPDPECKEVRRAVGITSEIEYYRNRGKYEAILDPLKLAEALVQEEISFHKIDRLVMGPVTIVQIKNATPNWYRPGLCLSQRPVAKKKTAPAKK